jgi:hypothetical protein
MTTMPKFKTDTPTTTDIAYGNGCVIRALGVICCPCCLARLRASAVRDIGEGEYAWTCQRCHSDALTITTR